MEPLPRPEVRVSDPSRPDLLREATDPVAERAEPSRPRWVPAVALVVAAALGFGAAELRQSQQEAAEERRLDAVVAVSVDADPSSFPEYTEDDAGPHLLLTLRLRNEGPRDVVVRSASLVGSTDDRSRERQVPLFGEERLTVRQPLSCPAQPLPRNAQVSLVVVSPGGEQTVLVDLPRDLARTADDIARQACGDDPNVQSIFVGAVEASLEPQGLVALVQVSNGGAQDLSVTSFSPAPGLTARLLDEDGAVLDLPATAAGDLRDLPRDPFTFEQEDVDLELLVELRVDDCSVVSRQRDAEIVGDLFVGEGNLYALFVPGLAGLIDRDCRSVD